MKKFWNWVRDETEPQERTLRLEGTIAEESWFDDDVTPAIFREELFADAGPITVWINSPGGDCVAAAQIYNMLMDYPHDITVKVDGIAASAASVIAMAGTRVIMTPVSLMMIHNPLTVAMGDSDEMRRAIQLLDEVKESILNAYEIKTGLSRARLSHLMDGETWMNAKKALELGFCDEIAFQPQTEESLLAQAQAAAEDYCRADFHSMDDPPETVRLAVLLMASHFYECRDSSDRSAYNTMMRAFQALLYPNRVVEDMF